MHGMSWVKANNGKLIFLFATYSYLTNILFTFMLFLPHFVRTAIFRALLKKLGDSPMIDDKVYFRYPWKVSIGDHVFINRGCEFFPSGRLKEGTITLGNNVVLSPHVKIYAAGHDYDIYNLAESDTAGAVVVGDHVWIGANAVILQGVTLGEGAVIGAGSVVSKSVPAFSVAMGNPARVVKERTMRADATT